MADQLTRKLSIDDEVDLCSLSVSSIHNSVQNDAFIRAKLLEKADDYYNRGMECESITHQVEALCIGFRSKFMLEESAKSRKTKLNDLVDEMVADLKQGLTRITDQRQDQLRDEFLPDFSMLHKNMGPTAHSGPTARPASEDDILGRCSELPAEWTVVQITKQFDPQSSLKTASEILESSSGIFLTVLKYPHMAINGSRPMTIRLPNKSDGLFASNAKISEMIKATMKMKDVQQYAKSLAEIDQTIAEVLDQMFLWLGPYIVLFLGVFKEATARKEEESILRKVQTFFDQESIEDTRQLAMTFLVARGIDLLNHDDLEAYSIDCCSNSQRAKRMLDFLTDLKETSKLSYKFASFPSILIVDELLDGFYWEMLLPDKELCRCSALHILLDISRRYQDVIRGGYLRMDVKRGTALINLGDDLPVMQKRITSFFDYWKPTWKQYVKVTPKEQDITELLKDSNVIVYSGHGSGQQFVNPETIHQLKANCVVFLFGCESVKLISYGRSSERIGIHLFYHYILCPLIVGALTIVTDTPTDQICVLALSTWMRADKPREKHMQYMDRKKFKEGRLEFSNVKLFKELTDENDPNLLNIFTKIRQISTLPLWMRATFVLRGIPVWNID